MREQDLVRNGTTDPPIAIRTTGLSVEARKMFDSIARRAYEIFESKGRLWGCDLDNWIQAEAELFMQMPFDVSESGEGLTVRAEVRGYTPRELEIDMEPQRVTIIGKHESEEETRTGSSVRPDKQLNQLLRCLQLPMEVDTSHVTARLRRGVLELEMKKAIPAEQNETKPEVGGTLGLKEVR
jgi:HSP20 family molecular chaperone IbpA